MDGNVATGAQSMRAVREFIVHPDEIKRLDTGEAWLKVANFGSYKVKIAPEPLP